MSNLTMGFADKKEWDDYLKSLGIKTARHIRIATEGALLGHLFERGLNPDLAIVSDDAGQFNILLHALCWVHAERLIHKLIPRTEEQRIILKDILDRPDLPLHNNLSESDIREYAKRRKVSGGIRSENGRRSRDTFTSLKKTARKLKVSFWDYLNDRNAGAGSIPQLGNLIRQFSQCNTS